MSKILVIVLKNLCLCFLVMCFTALCLTKLNANGFINDFSYNLALMLQALMALALMLQALMAVPLYLHICALDIKGLKK